MFGSLCIHGTNKVGWGGGVPRIKRAPGWGTDNKSLTELQDTPALYAVLKIALVTPSLTLGFWTDSLRSVQP
jgi:hypothetical protein